MAAACSTWCIRFDLDINPAVAGVAAVISGHSHRPELQERGGILYLNPGSAGPRRFDLPITLAKITLTETGMSASIVPLRL